MIWILVYNKQGGQTKLGDTTIDADFRLRPWRYEYPTVVSGRKNQGDIYAFCLDLYITRNKSWQSMIVQRIILIEVKNINAENEKKEDIFLIHDETIY